jgi:Flp pilus assembly protein TadB
VFGNRVDLRDFILAVMDQMDLRYQQRFEAQTKAIDAALLAAKEAVTKAENATEKRFESVNEFRDTLSDQAATFITRVEYASLEKRVTELATRQENAAGRGQGLSALWGYFVALAGVLIGVAALLAR